MDDSERISRLEQQVGILATTLKSLGEVSGSNLDIIEKASKQTTEQALSFSGELMILVTTLVAEMRRQAAFDTSVIEAFLRQRMQATEKDPSKSASHSLLALCLKEISAGQQDPGRAKH